MTSSLLSQECEASSLVAESPKLYVLSRPNFDADTFKSFLKLEETTWERSPESTSAEEIVELAGRICYMSFGQKQSPKSNHNYIAHLIRQEHESVLEHVSWTFLLTGVSRAFTHQLVRHRVGFSFSQLSQQYHDESEVRFVVPEEIKANEQVFRQWLQEMDALRKIYSSLSNKLASDDLAHYSAEKETRRAIRSAARSVLPNATETKIVFTANARALRHFLKLRGSLVGDIEMRKVAALVFSEINHEAPALVSDFQIRRLDDGYPSVELFSKNMQ